MKMPEMEEEQSEEVAQDSQEGYCIELYVKPGGTYSVQGPVYKEKPSDESEPHEQGESAESLPDAIKMILSIARENPVGRDDMGEMQAGFDSGPAGKMKPKKSIEY